MIFICVGGIALIDKEKEQTKNKWISNMSFTFSAFLLIMLLANYIFKMEASKLLLSTNCVFILSLIINGIVHRKLYNL